MFNMCVAVNNVSANCTKVALLKSRQTQLKINLSHLASVCPPDASPHHKFVNVMVESITCLFTMFKFLNVFYGIHGKHVLTAMEGIFVLQHKSVNNARSSASLQAPSEGISHQKPFGNTSSSDSAVSCFTSHPSANCLHLPDGAHWR